jgi:hypothetical protein
VGDTKQKLKEGIKILGIACASFNRVKDKQAELYGIVFRGNKLLEGVMKTAVTVDGNDASENIIRMVDKSPHKKQLKMIITRGVTVAGFNYLDLNFLHQQTSLPIVAVIDRKPNMKEIKVAIKNVAGWSERFSILKENSQNLRPVLTAENEQPVYVQSIGLSESTVTKTLQELTVVGRIPEPIRVARLIATAEKY